MTRAFTLRCSLVEGLREWYDFVVKISESVLCQNFHSLRPQVNWVLFLQALVDEGQLFLSFNKSSKLFE